MPFSPKTLEEKPYNLCLNCAHIGKRCDGPNFLAMSTERLCEWCRIRKDYLHLKNVDIADKSGVSVNTVERIMKGDCKDLRISTIQAVVRVLINGTWGQYPCAMASELLPTPESTEDRKHAEECAQMQNALLEEQRKKEYLMERVEFLTEQLQQKDALLKERGDFMRRKDRAIVTLSLALGIALILIITALVVDSMNSDIGFFWLSRLFTPNGSGVESFAQTATTIMHMLRG